MYLPVCPKYIYIYVFNVAIEKQVQVFAYAG